VGSALYPFLISSLPGLRLGEKPFYASEAFLEQCRPHLAPERFADLAAVRLLPAAAGACCCDTAQRWRDFEVFLRNRLAEWRAARTQGDAERWRRPEADVFPSLQREIDEALAAPEPLARERALDALRWRHLDGLVPGHELDFDALVNYRLRLQLVEKWADLDPERGRVRVRELAAATVAQARTKRKRQGQT
jgi:hypothetical protein